VEAEQALPEIIKSLRLLGSPASDQIALLASTGIAPAAKLRGDFDDVAALIPRLIVEEYISPRQAVAIRTVHRALADLADGGEGVWTVYALRTRDEWERVRQTALRALSEMNPLTTPRLSCPE
jgi:hypothetical protein